MSIHKILKQLFLQMMSTIFIKKQALKFWQELDKKRYIPVFAEYKVHSEFLDM